MSLITREPVGDGTVRLIFQLPAELMEGTVSVIGDFNDSQPGVTTFGGRGSMRSAAVEVAPGRRYRFRYVTEAGKHLNEVESDGQERDDQGTLSAVVDLTS